MTVDLSKTPEFAIEEARRGVREFIRRATGKEQDNPAVIWRSRMHVLAAAIKPGRETKWLEVWCDCGWSAPAVPIGSDVQSHEDLDDEFLAEAVAPWREHLRLSGRMFRQHTRITRAEKEAERAAASG